MNKEINLTSHISGGSILTEILRSSQASQLSFSALIRRPEQAAKLEALGVKTLRFQGLDDLEACKDAASQHDSIEIHVLIL